MKNLLALLVPVLALSVTDLKAQPIKYSQETESKIKQVENNLCGWVQTGTDDKWNLLERMKKYHLNGISIAVIHNYKIEWARGYGIADVAENRPVTEKTLFQAASISKSLNSLAVLRLVEEKKIDCDSDVNKYLKSWKFPYDEKSKGKKITVKELLSHTAGLTVHGFPGYEAGKPLPSIIQILNGQKPANNPIIHSFEEPGTKVNYSGGGITILQLLITDVTGMPYEDYMQKYVLNPIGMTASCYCQPPSALDSALLATAYKFDGKPVPGKYHIYPEMAAAGLWTNPTDLSRYIIEEQLALKGESQKVLSQAMTRFRLIPVMGNSALGSFIVTKAGGTESYFNHSGGNEGFLSNYFGSMEGGDGVVVMINSEDWTIIDEITNSVASVYNWKNYYYPQSKKVITVSPGLLQNYIGRYQMGFRRFEIVNFEDGLGAIMSGTTPWKVYFSSDSDFFVKETAGNGRFKFGAGGKVKGFEMDGMKATKIK
jgi:CubicO group peptidase (beta-lactamase class C family)